MAFPSPVGPQCHHQQVSSISISEFSPFSTLTLPWGGRRVSYLLLHLGSSGGKLLQQSHPLGHAPITGLIFVTSDDRAEGSRGYPGEFRGFEHPKNLPERRECQGSEVPGSPPPHRGEPDYAAGYGA